MKIDILTLFPEMFKGPFDESIVKRAQEKGKVEISFAKESAYLVVNIRDNGSGFNPDQIKQKPSGHKSVGMSITQKRLELLGKQETKLITVSDIKTNAKQSGTEVKIKIKLEKDTNAT